MVISSKRRKRPSVQQIAQPAKSKSKKESKTSPNYKPEANGKEPMKLPDAEKVPPKVPTKTPPIEKVRKMIPDRSIPQDSSHKPKTPAKPKLSANTSTPLEMLQDRDDEPLTNLINESLIDDLPILVPCSSPIENIPTMIFECPLCLKNHPPDQDLFSNCDYSNMIKIPELDTWMPKF